MRGHQYEIKHEKVQDKNILFYLFIFAIQQNKIQIRVMSEQDPQYWRFKSNDIWTIEDKQPNSALVIKLHVGLFIVNICFIKPAVTFVCYLRFDSCNQNWSVYCREAAKSDMTNAGQTVQVFSQSGRRDWSSLESIMIKPYWHWASIKTFFFDGRQKRKIAADRLQCEKVLAKNCISIQPYRAFINPNMLQRIVPVLLIFL